MGTTATYALEYPASTAHPRIWEHIQTLADDVDAALATLHPAWVDNSASFVLGAATTPPTKGNSVYVTRYLYVHPDLIHFEGKITIGASGWAPGTGGWRFPLPVAASAGSIAASVGYIHVEDSGTGYHQASAVIGAGGTYFEGLRPGTGSSMAPGSPMVWAANDTIRWSIDYEPV